MVNESGKVSGMPVVEGLDKCEIIVFAGDNLHIQKAQEALQEIIKKSEAFYTQQSSCAGPMFSEYIITIYYKEKDS